MAQVARLLLRAARLISSKPKWVGVWSSSVFHVLWFLRVASMKLRESREDVSTFTITQPHPSAETKWRFHWLWINGWHRSQAFTWTHFLVVNKSPTKWPNWLHRWKKKQWDETCNCACLSGGVGSSWDVRCWSPQPLTGLVSRKYFVLRIKTWKLHLCQTTTMKAKKRKLGGDSIIIACKLTIYHHPQLTL